MAYTKTNWVNEGPPAIDADNLNHIEDGIYANDQKIASLENKFTNLQAGSVAAITLNKNTYVDFDVTFENAFDSVPVVVVGMATGSTGYGCGSLSVAVMSVSTTGFTGRIFNADGTAASRSPAIRWIALAAV